LARCRRLREIYRESRHNSGHDVFGLGTLQDNLKTVKLDLPETAPGNPDYLKELKWETDWLLTMQYPDGSGRGFSQAYPDEICPVHPG
jgi:hypothetical protein